MQLAEGEPAARQSRHVLGGPDVDNGVERVAQPEFQAGSDLVADAAVEFGPAVGGHDQMYAVVEHPGQRLA
jgi:hypothetical protein